MLSMVGMDIVWNHLLSLSLSLSLLLSFFFLFFLYSSLSSLVMFGNYW